MGVIINTALVALATMLLVMGFSFYFREKNAGIFRRFLLLLGIFAALWAGGYGVMGSVEDLSMAYIPRAVGLFGVLGFLTVEFNLALKLVSSSSVRSRVFMILSFILAIVDFACYAYPYANHYIRVGTRTAYYSNWYIGVYFHCAYIAVYAVSMSILVTKWYRLSKYKREKEFILWSVLANLIIMVFMVTDIVFPLFRRPSFPGTAFGVSITYVMLWIFAERYNAFSLSIRNLSNYIYDSVNAAILVLNENYEISLANKAARKLLNMDTVRSTKLSDWFNITPDNIITYMNLLVREDFYELKTTARNHNISCSLNMSVIKDNHGDPYCVICFVYDLSMEENMIREISQANRAKSAFLASMSHEIRTPINAILGMDEIILRESKDKDTITYATAIDNAGKNLLSLVNDILDFSKIESGKMEIISVEYEIASLVNDSYSMIILRAMEKNLKVEIKNASNIPSRLMGDELRIRQIIINLLTNAVKYTPEGKISFKVDWEPLNDENILLNISVEDTGIGIEKEDIAHLFDSFQRVDEEHNRTIEGTGLGLAISKQMVTNMNGTIEVESEPGKGSKFMVSIPQKVVNWEPIGDIAINYTVKPEGEYRERFHAPLANILVVDDVSMNLQVFEGLLKKTHVNIDTALSGEQCLKMVTEKKYDIIFMDHMMPYMNGVEVFYKMKELEGNLNRNTPVIMLTANAIIGMEEEFLKKGFTNFMSKPIKGKDLEKMVMQYLPSALMQEIRGIDFAVGLEYCANNRDFYFEMLNAFAEGSKIADMDEMLEKEEWEQYKILAHALKSTSLSIGAEKLSENARKLEFAAREGQISYILENHRIVMDEYGNLIYKIKGLISLYSKESNF